MNKEQNSRLLARTWPFIRYKEFEDTLRKTSAAWFANRGYETHRKMNYCLARHELWPNNIICRDVVAYIQKQHESVSSKNSFPLHKYLHHGLSSQAMAFNLIGPLIISNKEEKFRPLKRLFERKGIEWPEGEIHAEFERDNSNVFNEDAGQPTSLDIAFLSNARNIFVEVKLAERGFGGCSVFERGDCEGRNPYPDAQDSCYLAHIKRKYWDKINEHGFKSIPLLNSPICALANYYQFFREVLFSLSENGIFILLHDERNPAFFKTTQDGLRHGGLWPFLVESIPQEKRHLVRRITVQEVVSAIEETGGHEDWINDFKEKYGLI